MVSGLGTYRRVSLCYLPLPCTVILIQKRLGQTIRGAYTLTFQTNLYSILPPSFVRGFKTLCASTLPPPESGSETTAPSTPDTTIWEIFETLGLLDRYEGIIASVGYEHIEAHVLSNCTGKWAEPMMEELRSWMSQKIVPWMLLMYARGAASSALQPLSLECLLIWLASS